MFKRTVDWGVDHGITTSTYHILTPYPGTESYKNMEVTGRILTRNWDRYDTRHVMYKTVGLSADALGKGYWWAYDAFYSWKNIFKPSLQHDSVKHIVKHFLYTGGRR